MKQKLPSQDHITELLESLPRVIATPDDQEGASYTYTDRARDFMTVFGSNEQGRRVLAQISQICDPRISLADADKSGTLAFKSGMRHVMLEIMACMVARKSLKIETEKPKGP